MRLETGLLPLWPKLAWVAHVSPGSDTVRVWHGPGVETAGDWCAEAVWAGDYAAGDFDRTDLVFGSGIRIRGDRVVFVSAGSTLDRLWHCPHEGSFSVSNSLPALLARTGLSLRDDHLGYAKTMKSICGGLKAYTRTFPSSGSDLSVLYFSNLVFDGECLREIEKPDAAPPLTDYETYRGFLFSAAERLAANMNHPARRGKVVPLATLSSGYDSPAAAVVAAHTGCRQAVTFRQSTSLWRGQDAGHAVAGSLGFSCRSYDRTASRYPHEEAIWAVVGRPGVLNWTLFDYAAPLCLLFTGCYGDKVWDRRRRDFPDSFVTPSVADLGIGEFRLIEGVLHCPVPFWGMRHWREIERISFLPEMVPWVLNNDYDRPIPRRLVEEAGVPRGAFGVRKMNTSHEAPFLWPYSPGCRKSFARYLRDRDVYVPPGWLLWLLRRNVHLWHLLDMNVLRPLGLRKGPRPWERMKAQSLLFQWANAELKRHYEEGLKAAGASPPIRPS
ncbi:MAG TPA: hypothetical protein VNA25_05475 [Phycisphaerae bacterium]|nr:hypothetical protein [Phycisphaerae bacterium]